MISFFLSWSMQKTQLRSVLATLYFLIFLNTFISIESRFGKTSLNFLKNVQLVVFNIFDSVWKHYEVLEEDPVEVGVLNLLIVLHLLVSLIEQVVVGRCRYSLLIS